MCCREVLLAGPSVLKIVSDKAVLLVGPTVFRGKFCQIPRRRLPNSADDRGKFLEFRGSPRSPMSIA